MHLLRIAVVGLCLAGSSTISFAAEGATKVVTLGTRSGPNPTVHRAQTSNLLIVNGARYVIDAGDGVTRRLTRYGSTFRDIDQIFITHPHSDHVNGLSGLMGVIYAANRAKPVGIIGPPGINAGVQGLMQFLSVDADIRISDGGKIVPITKIFTAKDVEPGLIFQDENIKVTAVENTHFNFQTGSPGYGKYKSYSYRFDKPDRSIVFTGDTGSSEAVSALAKDVDLFISEVTSLDDWKAVQVKTGRWAAMNEQQQASSVRHMVEEHVTPEQVGKMAAAANAKTVVLTHIAATLDPNDEYARFGAEVNKYFSGRVLVAKDLMEF
jgi:ribonuclease BN (tRNA processing enzyme)